MPNAPCLVGEMAACFARGKYATTKDSKLIKNLLDSGGISFEVEEQKLDAVTGLNGSGPAFVAYLIQAFIKAGIKSGLTRELSKQLSIQTFFGTAKLLKEKNLEPEELISIVSSKKGATLAGRKILESSDLDKILVKAIQKSSKRARELGK